MGRIHTKGDPLIEDQNNEIAKDTRQKQNLQNKTN